MYNPMLQRKMFAYYKIPELQQRNVDAHVDSSEVLFCVISLPLAFTFSQNLVFLTSSPSPSLSFSSLCCWYGYNLPFSRLIFKVPFLQACLSIHVTLIDYTSRFLLLGVLCGGMGTHLHYISPLPTHFTPQRPRCWQRTRFQSNGRRKI